MSKPADVLDALFEGIDSSPTPAGTNPTTTTTKSEKDILAELDLLTADRPNASRPTTPRSSVRRSFEGRRPIDTGTPRRSGEGYGIGTGIVRRDSSDVITPSKLQTPVDSNPPTFAVTSPVGVTTTQSPKNESKEAGGGGWLGSIWSTASAAVKTAEAAYKEIQSSEEGRKWTSQVRDYSQAISSNINISNVQKLSGEIRSRALPTLSNFLHTIAPPIASHEQLRIHITHDIANYPSIDTIVYGVFDRVMQQVEGGDLLVVQRGGESKPRSSLASGWSQGPWYKASEPRALNSCFGPVEDGCKLARAAAESYAHEYIIQNPQAETEDLNPSNPTRKSDIFLAIQPTTYPSPTYLLPTSTPSPESPILDPDANPEPLTTFALHLLDPNHQISFSTVSQSVPAKWLEWIDSPVVPDDIAEIVNSGGVDPREWVVEWIEETLGLAVGVVAQRYVAKRMNVGEGYTPGGKGKERGAGVGEEARAGIM